MALDGSVIRAVVHELQPFVGGRANKIYQPTGSDIVLHLRSQNGHARLLLSANPTYPRLHLTEQSFVNPSEAPMFCMLLRKHCEGALLESIEQVDFERIVKLRFRQRDELGDLSVREIVVEIMGRHSNIILLDPSTGTVLDGIHHVTPAISAHRVVLPGSRYVDPPDQGKRDPLDTDNAAFLHAWEAGGELAEETPADRRLVDRFNGVSPLLAKEIVHRAGGDGADSESLWSAFAGVMEAMRQQQYRPQIVEDEPRGKAVFAVVDLTHATGEPALFASTSEMLERFYGTKAERDTVKQRVSDLLRLLHNERAKNIKKLEKLEETIREAKDADKYRILGDLLTASMHLLKKGDKQVEVVNYYDEEQRPATIELDPLLTPSDNAQRYFKKYTKSKTSLVVVREQIESTHEEIRYLETVLAQLQSAGLGDIEEIREELVGQGYIRDRGKRSRKKKKKDDKPALTRFTSSEGAPIYVGKNNTQNEYLTKRFAHSSDTWLHTKDIPGSHVVIRGADFGDETLREAAQLAAYFSQARESSQVPVDYTLVRHVWKPNGAKPGFVLYEQQKTLFVTPDEALVKSLQGEPRA